MRNPDPKTLATQGKKAMNNTDPTKLLGVNPDSYNTECSNTVFLHFTYFKQYNFHTIRESVDEIISAPYK